MTNQRRQPARRPAPQQAGSSPVAVIPDDTPDTPGELLEDTPLVPSARPVKMRISADMLRQLLRLRPEVAITDAVRDSESGLIEFDIVSPTTPPDAVELLVTYRHTGGQDPIHAISTWSTQAAP